MKRLLSLLLCAAILFAVPMALVPEVSADNDYKMIVSFDEAADISVFNYTYDYVPMPTSLASAERTKFSNYSAKWSTGTIKFKWNQNIEIAGYKYINLWIYSDKDLSMRAETTGAVTSGTKNTTISTNAGWNLVTLNLIWTGSAHHNCNLGPGETALTSIVFNAEWGQTIPEGCVNAGMSTTAQPNIRNTTWYIDSIFLTKDVPTNNDFTANTIQNDDSKVLPNIRGDKTIKFNAPGLINKHLDVNKVTVEYCEEGTHDEATHSAATLIPETDYNLGHEENTLKLIFENPLHAGTTYNVHIDGEDFLGARAMPFNDYDLSFRTLGEGENIPPQVSLLDLTANQRFFPAEGAITLKAEASDANGSVEKVEFYAGETRLGVGTEGTGDDAGTYTFVWENPEESENGYNITAKAYDNNDDVTTSEAVRIVVLDKKNPKVALTAPTEDVVVSRNFGGVEKPASLTVSADVTCAGTTPAEVEFVLDGNTVHTATNVASSYSYTFTDLSLGEHSVYVRVTDDLGMQGVSKSITVNVKDFGTEVPGLYEEDFEGYEEKAMIDWTKDGEEALFEAADYLGNMVAKLSTENAADSETVSVQKRYRNSLTATPWEASVRVNLGDMTFNRKVEILGATEGLVLDFKTDGGVYVGNEKKADYRVGEWYDIKLVVNPASKELYAILVGDADDEVEADKVIVHKTNLADTYSRNGATIRVSQEVVAGKSGYVLIDDAGIYKIDETQVEATGIAVYEGGTPAADLDNVPVSADSLTISLNEAMGSSLKNKVKVIDTEENRQLSLTFDDSTVYFNEELRGNRIYQVIVTTGVSGTSGKTIAKSGVYTFKTEPKPVAVTGGFDESATLSGTLSETGNEVTCPLNFTVTNVAGFTAYIVGVVYDGNEMADIMIQEVTSEGPVNARIPVDAYTPDTFIEVFVVEDLDTMVPVSEAIYQLK